MSDPALFEKIKSKIKPKAIGQCPNAPGDLAVYVSRTDTNKPVPDVQVKAKGPTPGAGKTDAEGWVIFADRTPGAYQADVQLPASLSKFQLASATQAGAVACANTEILHFVASPPPVLKVKVVSRRPKGDKVVEEVLSGVDIDVQGPAQYSAKSTEDWSAIRDMTPGTYRVSVKSLGARAPNYLMPDTGSATLTVGDTKEVVLVAPPVASLRIILFDRQETPIKGASWVLDSPLAANGETGADGLIRVEKIALARGTGKLNVRLPRPPVPLKPAAPATPAPDPNATPPYPPKIDAAQFNDKDPTPTGPDADPTVVNWTLKIGLHEDYDNDDGAKDRLGNLGFGCTRLSDAAATTKAVKAYQRVHMKDPNGSGALADAKAHIKNRHDNP